MTTYTYNFNNGIGTLDENPRMEKPKHPPTWGLQYHHEWINYNNHLSTLRHIQVADPAQWKQGEVVGEGEFGLQWQHFVCGIKGERDSEWIYSDEEHCKKYYPNASRIVAHRVPAEQPKEKATELIEKFKPFVTTWDCYNDVPMNEASIIKDATQCAIICVEEILKYEESQCHDPAQLKYWQSVLTILKTKA